MTRAKKLIALSSVLVVLALAALILTLVFRESGTVEEEPAVSIYEMSEDTAAALSWQNDEETVSLVYSDDAWAWADDAQFPLDQSLVQTVVDSFVTVSADKTITEPGELADYGLETPLRTVSITDENGTVTLSFGDTAGISGDRYCSLGDGNVYLVPASLYSALDSGLYDLVETESLPSVSADAVTAVSVQGDAQSLQLIREEDSGLAYSDSYVWFMQNADGYTTLDNELSETFVTGLAGIAWLDCVDYSADETGLAEYGLDAPVTVTLSYTNSDSENVTFTYEIGGESPNGCYARIAGSSMVYEIDSTLRDTALYTTANDLLPDEVLLLDWEDVDTVTVTLDAKSYVFTRPSDTASGEASGEASEEPQTEETADEAADETAEEAEDETEEVEWTLNGEAAGLQSVLQQLTDMASTGSAAGTSAGGTEEITFVISRAGREDITLTFLQYNSSSCLVQLNGESTVFTARQDVVSLTEAVNAIVLGE